MNGKQAKKLRRIALGLATTFDQAGRKIRPNGYVAEEHRKASPSFSSSQLPGPEAENARDFPRQQPAVTVHNRHDSLRQIYRTMKKGVVSGKLS